jgi:hypothetical protein
MTVSDNWRALTGVASFLLFATTIVWLLLYGKPDNSLHQSALSWSYFGLLGIIVSVGFSSVMDLITLKK